MRGKKKRRVETNLIPRNRQSIILEEDVSKSCTKCFDVKAHQLKTIPFQSPWEHFDAGVTHSSFTEIGLSLKEATSMFEVSISRTKHLAVKTF